VGTQQLVSSARQRTCASVVDGQKIPCEALKHPPHFQDLSPPDFFLFPRLKRVFWKNNDLPAPRKSLQKQRGHWKRYPKMYVRAYVCYGSCITTYQMYCAYRETVSKNVSKTSDRLAKVCHCQRELLWREHYVNTIDITSLISM
jgi:hypothetical protein